MEHAKLALTILAIDLRNARNRNQRTRCRHGSKYALVATNTLVELTYHLKRLRTEVNRLERIEKAEMKYRKDGLRKARGNRNQRLTGTYGK